MSSAEIITKAREHALLADLLLIRSGELLKLVVELGRTVGLAATTLKAATSKLHRTTEETNGESPATTTQMNQTVIDTANIVVQLSAKAAINIRRIIGWNDHPYLHEQRNGEATLIGTEHALSLLFKEMKSLAGPSINECPFAEIHQRIGAMATAAEKNTRTATANVAAVEAVGAMAIKISRARQNH